MSILQKNSPLRGHELTGNEYSVKKGAWMCTYGPEGKR